jgi:hypothetical protein
MREFINNVDPFEAEIIKSESKRGYIDLGNSSSVEDEYNLSLSYLEELKNVYTEDGELDKTKKRDVLVISVWKDLIEKAVVLTGDRNNVYTIVSRDFQRFFTSFRRYSGILQNMWETEDSEIKEGYKVLIRKIVDFDFFENTFHEDSNNFFKLRKWAETLGDKELTRKINSHLDCIVTSFFRQLKRRYGLG